MADDRQIWLDETKYAVVDEIDFEWLSQWKWHAHPNSTGRKFYASRMTRVSGKNVRVYMHKEILKRAGKRKRSPQHSIGDHDDGDSLNNRRGNLFWATLRWNNTRHRLKHLLNQKNFDFDEAVS